MMSVGMASQLKVSVMTEIPFTETGVTKIVMFKTDITALLSTQEHRLDCLPVSLSLMLQSVICIPSGK